MTEIVFGSTKGRLLSQNNSRVMVLGHVNLFDHHKHPCKTSHNIVRALEKKILKLLF